MTTTPAVASTPALPGRRFGLALDRRARIVVALLILYIIWGTTYLVIRFALEGFTPYWLMGLRFLAAGGILFAALRMGGAPLPTLRQWRSAAIVGGLLLGGGMGSVALAEESISSGLVATLVAVAPLWTMLFGRLWGRRPLRGEWIGVLLGLAGVGLLSLEGNLQANPVGIALVLFASASWSFGSVWMKHLDMPAGAMGSAAEMLAGGVILCVMAVVRGEPFPTDPTPGSLLAIAYLIGFGSLLTMTSYSFLLNNVSATLATSYSFVNPAIALFLGAALGGEIITGSALFALPIILVGVWFVFRAQSQSAAGTQPTA
ncbi:MAG: drug/metabolite exporter YedA [bacterium]|nr:drug/metabolite exporter YedA [bacterium]